MSGAERESHVIATYREIAAHFGLKGPDQGRTKAKRAEWPAEPQNHPADPIRVRVPRDAWDAASPAQERVAASRRREPSHLPPQDGRALPSQANEPLHHNGLERALNVLSEHLERERSRADQAEAEAQDAREQAVALKGDLEAIRIALAIAEERASAAEGGRTRLLAERDAALVEAAKLREERGAAQGEVEGLKLGLEHAHGHVATARQEATAARTEAQEAQRKAAAADQTARSLKADLERLRGRGLLARLINRPR